LTYSTLLLHSDGGDWTEFQNTVGLPFPTSQDRS